MAERGLDFLPAFSGVCRLAWPSAEAEGGQECNVGADLEPVAIPTCDRRWQLSPAVGKDRRRVSPVRGRLPLSPTVVGPLHSSVVSLPPAVVGLLPKLAEFTLFKDFDAA